MIDFIINSFFTIIMIIFILWIYSIIRIYFVTKEIKKTWTLKNIWFFEYLIREFINEDIKNRHESISKKAD